MNNNRIKKNMFVGSIDQLMAHCAKLDVDELDHQLEKQWCINYIMDEVDCNEKTAEEIYQEISDLEIKQQIESLVEQGFLYISGKNTNGDYLYSITEKGEQFLKNSKKKE